MTSTFSDPQIADGEKCAYTISIGDKPRQFEALSVVTHDGDRYVSVMDISVPASTFVMSVEQRFIRADGRMRAESYRAETRFDDKVVSREEGYFVDTKHLQFGADILPFPSDVMPLLGGGILLRGLDFAKGAKAAADVWLTYSVLWPLSGKVEKRTEVEVPGGRFDCWQVKLRPGFSHINSLLDKVISGILPPFVIQLEAAAPHRMVRFSFPTGPMPWNPRGVLELTA
ncbi:hypothetical protein [Nocardia sp. NPDC020380]|uniref:hypothetical protein n=1 Tax=Nocardia sp. NPDC020380 TaxID=3364309 RepID=UPI0037BA4672